MTENEAKEYIRSRICNEKGIQRFCRDNCIYGKDKCAFDMAIQALEEIQQYRAIGTIEEFKDLKEKNEPKRLLTREEKYPQNYGIYSTSDRWCPYCRGLVFTGDWSVYKQNIMYKRTRCGCGQKLDWQ